MPFRTLQLFEGYTIKFVSGKIILRGAGIDVAAQTDARDIGAVQHAQS